MMCANILEPPKYGEGRLGTDDALARCVESLATKDRDYFRRRARQESEAALRATCREARKAHEELAAAYRMLSSSNRADTNPHLASDLVMFQFNPKPTNK